MKLQAKRIVPFILIIIIGSLFYFLMNSAQTVYNSENAFGNTSGNLFNGGLFCEYNDKIYFSNMKDEGALYSMDLELKNFKKISNDKIGYINAVGSYLYYSRMNNKKQTSKPNIFAFKNVGIYRIKFNGKDTKSLYDNPSGLINVYGNSLYYQHYNKEGGLKFYKVGIDGSGEKKLSDEAILPMTIVNNMLYYTGVNDDHFLYSMNLTNNSKSVIYEGNCYAPIINKNYIYFISLSDNYFLYRIDLNGKNKTLISGERCSTYNITEDGKYLYYQVDNNKDNRIGIMNLGTGDVHTIKTGDYKNIHILDNYVFFTDFEEKETYYIPTGSSNNLKAFNPSKLSN
ncbi:MAG: DUF5050 domain-containing protein [Anaerocolumna sp.]